MNFLLTGNIKKTDASGNDQGINLSGLRSDSVANEVSSDEAESPLPEATSPMTNSFVDKLTMEYMMNRTHYKKYLAKTDTNKYQRLNEQLLYIQSHEEDIEEITSNLLQDFIRHGNFTKYNTIINTAFEEFLYTCVGYIKDTEYNNKNTDETI